MRASYTVIFIKLPYWGKLATIQHISFIIKKLYHIKFLIEYNILTS